MIPMEIWSGGQTGVDRAALDVAMTLGIPTGGWVPRGRLAEDGMIPARYATLREADSEDYSNRTWLNVRDTDATLILRWGPATGGTLETIEFARREARPLCEVDLSSATELAAANATREWLRGLGQIERLNVAGPRASQAPEVYERTRRVLKLAMYMKAKEEGRISNVAVAVEAAFAKEEAVIEDGTDAVPSRRIDENARVVEDAERRMASRMRDVDAHIARHEAGARARSDKLEETFDDFLREIDAESERILADLENEAAADVKRHAGSAPEDLKRLDEILSALQREADQLAEHADRMVQDAIAWMGKAENAVRAGDDESAKEYLDKYREAAALAEGISADAQAAREAVASYRAAARDLDPS